MMPVYQAALHIKPVVPLMVMLMAHVQAALILVPVPGDPPLSCVEYPLLLALHYMAKYPVPLPHAGIAPVPF